MDEKLILKKIQEQLRLNNLLQLYRDMLLADLISSKEYAEKLKKIRSQLEVVY